MKGIIIRDWSKIDLASPAGRSKLVGAVNAFLQLPSKNSSVKAAIKHFATKGDFPAEVLNVLEKYHVTPDWDTAFEDIFDIRDFTGTNESGFKILDVESTLTFNRVPEGEKAKIYKMSGTEAEVTFQLYGGGLGWHRTLLDDGKFWTLEDNTITFRNKAYSSRAQDFYDLIDAVSSGQNLAWQAPVPATLPNTDALYTAIRDAETINKACENIIVDLKDKGMSVNVNTPFTLLAPIQLKGRILRALSVQAQAMTGSPGQVHYNVDPRFTSMLSSSSSYYVIAPKRKAKGGYRLDLTVFGKFDEMSYSDVMVGWMRYGGAIAEENQFQRCATA